MSKLEEGKIFYRKPLNEEKGDFSIFSFNILKQNFTNDFTVKKKYIEEEFRIPLILQEIQLHKGDIISLLECDRYLEFRSNNEVFGEYESMDSTLNPHPDEFFRHGVSVFWKKSALKLIKFCEKQLSTYSRTALFFLFEHIRTKRLFIFVGLHLKAGRKLNNVKLRSNQVKDLLSIVQFLQTWENQANNNKIPIILAGDFNDIPGSKIYKTIVNDYDFSSAYGEFNEPYSMYTKFNSSSEVITKITLDYIFFSSRNKDLKVEEVLMPPDDPKRAFPSANPGLNYPSDHLSIKASFSFL